MELDKELQQEVRKLPDFFLYPINQPLPEIDKQSQLTCRILPGDNDMYRFAVKSDELRALTGAGMASSFFSSRKTANVVSPKTNKLFTIGNMPPVLPAVYSSVTILGSDGKGKSDMVALRCHLTRSRPPSQTNDFYYHQVKDVLQQIFQIPDTKYLDLEVNRLKSAIDKLFPDAPESFRKVLRADIASAQSHFETSADYAEKVVKRELLEGFILGQPSDIQEFVLRNQHMKMLLHTDEWNILSKYYSYDLLGQGLSYENFLNLFETFKNDPLLLCFEKLNPIHYQISITVSEECSVIRSRTLPDLTFEMFLESRKDVAAYCKEKGHELKTTLGNYEFAMAAIYQTLKNESEKNKHIFVPLRELRLLCIENYKDAPRIVYDLFVESYLSDTWRTLLDRLSEKTIIKIEGGPNIYLFSNWAHEQIIAKVFAHLTRKNTKECIRPQYLNTKERDQLLCELKSKQGHLLCEEQVAVMKMFIDEPITVLNGPAGSGKSDFLKAIHDVCHRIIINTTPPEENVIAPNAPKKKKQATEPRGTVMATSAQGNNASDLNKLFEGSAFTTHKLLWAHHRTCPTNGFDAERIGEKTLNTMLGKDCIFSQVRVLIIEEASLYTPGLAAMILGLLGMCASFFEKVVIVGDHRQLNSVGEGNFLKDVTQAMRSNCVFFKHDHRTSPSSKMLKHNADAILAMEPKRIVFDNSACFHYPFRLPRYGEPVKDYEIRPLIERIVKTHQLTPFDSHFVTRLNINQQLLENILKSLYVPASAKSGAFNPMYYYTYFKITFRNTTPASSVVPNKIYIIMAIFDINTNSLFAPAVSTNPRWERRFSWRDIEHTRHFPNRYDRDNRRYLLLYEISTFAKVHNSKKDLLQQLIFERDTFFDNLRQAERDTPTERMVKRAQLQTEPHIIRDPQETFVTVCWSDQRVQDSANSAFATTVHKFQGSQVNKIVSVTLSDDTNPYKYTAATRARDQYIEVGDLESFSRAITRQEPQRNSSLVDKINEHMGKKV